MSTTEVTRHTVYPTGYDEFVNSDKGMWSLTVSRVSRDRDLWMVESCGAAVGRKGQRDYIPLNSSRTRRWEKAYWFPLDEALTIARRYIDTHKWNMCTAAEASAFVAARQAAEVSR